MPTHLAGGAASAALMLASVGLALACERQGVTVNAVHPGITRIGRMDEGLSAEARRRGTSKEQGPAQTGERLPLSRLASP